MKVIKGSHYLAHLDEQALRLTNNVLPQCDGPDTYLDLSPW